MNPDTSIEEAVDYLWDKFGPKAIVEFMMARTAWNSRHASFNEQEDIRHTVNHLQDAIQAFDTWEKRRNAAG